MSEIPGLNRRQFLTRAAGAAAGLSLAAQSGSAAASPNSNPTAPAVRPEETAADSHLLSQSPHPMTLEAGGIVREAPRHTRVAADVDVLVAGGGPSGVAAALAAARSGASTLIIERHGMLGGLWTAGLLNPLFDSKGKGWIVAELIDRLAETKSWLPWHRTWTFDPETMKFLLESMAAEAGAGVWYYSHVADTIVEQDRVRGVIVESKSGREAVLAKVVVDCTGDGDVAARAGVPFQLGRLADSACQPMTLMFEITGLPEGYLQRNAQELYDALSTAIREQHMPVKLPFERVDYAPWIINVPRSGIGVVQATHVYLMNGLDTRDLTRATIEARRQAHELTQVMRQIPGLESIRISQTAPTVGVRETRHLQGRYRLDLEDVRVGRKFADAVTFGAFGVDIHEVRPGGTDKSAHGTHTRPYDIPYRCLLPDARSGLLFAGRCISGTHEAHASYRVTGTCAGMGQAAGLAAAISAAEDHSPEKLDGQLLRKALHERGAGFAPAR